MRLGTIGRTLRPIDVSHRDDRRWIGIAVRTVELRPGLPPAAG